MNGWKNRETWLVMVWFGDNMTKPRHVEWIKEDLESSLDKLLPYEHWASDFFKDFINLDLIDWDSIKQHFEGEEE